MTIIEIKRHRDKNLTTAILSAGISHKMKSYEPRSLLKFNKHTVIEHQIETIRSVIDGDIILVVGCKANKIIRKIQSLKNIRIVENQLFDITNAAESIRLAINNNPYKHILIMHGDIIFNTQTLKGLDYSKSCLLVDNSQQIQDREVGVTVNDGVASMLSYGLNTKWCQMCFFTGREYNQLKTLCRRDNSNIEGKLFFELINMIIELGGTFKCVEPPNMKIFEIDCMSDLYENTDS